MFGKTRKVDTDNESKEHLKIHDDDGMQRFTATGRPYKAPTEHEKASMGFNAMMTTANVIGTGAPNLLPVKFTDESLIDVPVMRPEDVGKAEMPRKKSLFSKRRSENTNFVTRKMPRGEYLAHYAKDDNGYYCGTEAPASDCILRKPEDIYKYRDSQVAAHVGVNTKDSDQSQGVIR